MTLLSTHAQREYSLVTGDTRLNPTHPIRRSPGAVRIGNRRILVEPPRYVSHSDLQAAEDARRAEWNASKQQARPHECAAVSVGEYCPHAV